MERQVPESELTFNALLGMPAKIGLGCLRPCPAFRYRSLLAAIFGLSRSAPALSVDPVRIQNS